jgi:hypothetical protein
MSLKEAVCHTLAQFTLRCLERRILRSPASYSSTSADVVTTPSWWEAFRPYWRRPLRGAYLVAGLEALPGALRRRRRALHLHRLRVNGSWVACKHSCAVGIMHAVRRRVASRCPVCGDSSHEKTLTGRRGDRRRDAEWWCRWRRRRGHVPRRPNRREPLVSLQRPGVEVQQFAVA